MRSADGREVTVRTASPVVPAPRTEPGPVAPVDPQSLVLTHLPVVGHIVAETMCRLPGHVSREDLAGAGVEALVVAARAYRPESGVPFAQYARIRVRGAVVDELRRTDWVSRGARRDSRRLADAEDGLRAELRRAPTVDELAATLGVTPADVDRFRGHRTRGTVMSLDSGGPHGDSDDGVLADLLASPDDDPEAHVTHAERVGELLGAVRALPERLRAVVEGYDLAERPMAELATDLGVSESRVSQMRSQALSLLRDALAEDDRVPDGPGPVARRRREAYVSAARSGLDLRSRLDAGSRALGLSGPRPADRVMPPRTGSDPSPNASGAPDGRR